MPYQSARVWPIALGGVVLLCAALAAPSAQSLVNNDPLQDARYPSLALERGGNPVIAWLEPVNGAYQALVKRWNGKSWVPLGGSINREPRFNAIGLSLALTAKDQPVLAWAERSDISDGKNSGPGKLYAARWDGQRWNPLGNSPSKKPASAADLPVMRLDANGDPVIAWNELSPDFNANSVFVDRWDGTAWQSVDIGTLSSDVSSASRSMDLAVDSRGTPWLAWSRQLFDPARGPLDFNLFVGPWGGSSWSKLGGVSLNINPERYAGSPSLALDAQDRPVVAWTEANAGFDVFVKRWTGSAWQRLGDSLNDHTGLANAPKLALDARGNPVVAWLENAGSIKVFVKRWDGQGWRTLGGFLNVDVKAYAESCSLAVAANGQPVVAWSEEVTRTQRRVYIKRWDGQNWRGLEQ